MIARQELKKVEADAAIDKETARFPPGRLFGLKIGQPLPLPDRPRWPFEFRKVHLYISV